MAKYNFTRQQFEEIKSLLKRRLIENRDRQKQTRAKIRRLGFKISDYFNGFSDNDFQNLFNTGLINIIDNKNSIKQSKPAETSLYTTPKNTQKKSLPPIVDIETTIIVFGTMPGENSLKYQQYYNNPNNQFWKIIFNIYNEGKNIDNYKSRIELLKNNKIGLWDVLSTCNRTGSSDSKIINPVLNDFESFFDKYKNIKTLIFNGKASYYYYKKFISVDFNKKLIQLNSTSSLNSHKNIDEKTEEWGYELRKNAT